MSKQLEGKVALVTGGSRGIGRAISLALAADGAIVGVHYGRNRAEADKVVGDIKAKGGDAFAVGADLTAVGAADSLFKQFDAEAAKRSGAAKFDILINNAGTGHMVDFANTTEAQLEEVYAVNFRSLFFITQKALTRLMDGGRVISISSIVARTPIPSLAAYSALKPALDNLTRTLAVELGGRNITVNSVAPGNIQTELNSFEGTGDHEAWVLSKQALKRVGRPDDVADVVAFLAGPKARWITGETIEVGGGSGLTF